MQYAVDEIHDDAGRLQRRLDAISSEGGRIISIMWQPAREVMDHETNTTFQRNSGYIVVSEHDGPS